MFRWWRRIDPQFLDDERLYRRFRDAGYGDEPPEPLQLLKEHVPYPNRSFNRSKYSRPTDVLVPDWRDWGVFSVRAGDFPPNLFGGEGKEYRFSLCHAPEWNNYAHTLLRITQGSTVLGYDEKVTGKVKREFRSAMTSGFKLVRMPVEP